MPPANQNPLIKKVPETPAPTGGPTLSPGNNPSEEDILRSIQHASPFPEAEKSQYTPNPELKTLRTYQGDVEETIGKKKESVVSIVAAEQKPEKKTILNIPTVKNRNIFVTHGIMPLLGLILFIAGAGTLFIIYYYTSLSNAPVAVTVNNSIISYTNKEDVDAGLNLRNGIVQNISNQKNIFNKPLGSLLYLHFTQNNTDVSSTDFFSAIANSAPQSLTRSFGPSYMSGIYSSDVNEPFIIMISDDYGQTYSGMLKWESTMASDLSTLFSTVIPALASGNTTFTDDTFNNQDVRVLRDSSGTIVLVYGFINKNIVVITSNETIFQAIIHQYINSKLVH